MKLLQGEFFGEFRSKRSFGVNFKSIKKFGECDFKVN